MSLTRAYRHCHLNNHKHYPRNHIHTLHSARGATAVSSFASPLSVSSGFRSFSVEGKSTEVGGGGAAPASSASVESTSKAATPTPATDMVAEKVLVPGDEDTKSIFSKYDDSNDMESVLNARFGVLLGAQEEAHNGKSLELSISAKNKDDIAQAKEYILDVVSGKVPAPMSKAYRELRKSQALRKEVQKVLEDEEVFKLQEEGEMVYKEQVPFVRDISEIIATKTPREIVEEKLIDETELEVQFRKYEIWLRHLRRQVIRLRKGKIKKKRRRVLSQRVKERDALYEMQYWQNWKPGDVAYQGYA